MDDVTPFFEKSKRLTEDSEGDLRRELAGCRAALKAEEARTRLLLELYERSRCLEDRELFDYVLEKTVALTDSQIGFFHRVNEDQETIQLTTWTRQTLKDCTAVSSDHYPMSQAGNWVDCVRQGRPVVYNVFPHSPNQKGLPDGHVPLQRFMSIPVVEKGRVHFVFGVGNKEAPYTDQDVERIQLVANELFKIIAHRRMEREVMAGEARYRMLFETMNLGVIHQDARGAVVAVNPAACRILERSEEELRDPSDPWHLWAWVDGGEHPLGQDDHPVRKSLFDGIRVEQAVLGREHPDHRSHCWVQVTSVPVVPESGSSVQGVCSLLEDISQRFLLEEQLRQSQKMEAVGHLAGGVAHDFNNILQAIIGYCDLMEREEQDFSGCREFLKEIERGAQRAAVLTRQLLAFSRRQVLRMENLPLNAVVEGLAGMVQRLIGANISMHCVYHDEQIVIWGDRGQVEQILINLCVNARDAMAEGGRLVVETGIRVLDESYCRVHTWAQPGSYGLLSVTDNGAGMGQEILSRIFEPFFTTKELGKGTGLGLSTVYGIIRQHGGLIHVYSEPGQGTCFKVYLPLSQGQPVDATDVCSGAPPRGTETILVAEDDDSVRHLVRHVLEHAGYEVLLVENGEKALTCYAAHRGRIAMMLMDVVMPVMGGREVYHALRDDPDRPVFLFASGYSVNAIHKGFILEPGIELIEKPYAPGDLLRRIRKLLDQVPRGGGTMKNL